MKEAPWPNVESFVKKGTVASSVMLSQGAFVETVNGGVSDGLSVRDAAPK
jgi:hypothetical protein